jgi:hypothetical protein
VGKGDARRLKLTYRNRLHDNISKKHGVNRCVVLETEDEREAFARERELITEHRTYVYGGEDHWGANFTVGGEGCSGAHWRLSEETKRRISEAHKGRQRTPEHQRKINESLRGKMSEVQRGKKHPHRGVPHTDAAREKMQCTWSNPVIAERRREAMRRGWEQRRMRLEMENQK